MKGWVCEAVAHVRELLAEHPGALMSSEVRVNPGTFYGVPDELWGKADVLVIPTDTKLVVVDFKFGFHDVEVQDNPQLSLYAIGSAERYGWRHAEYELVVLQPRSGEPEKVERLTREQLRERAESYRAGVIAATKANAALVPSDDGCRWCPAAGMCKALQARAQELTLREFADPRYLTPEEMATLLRETKRIKAGLDAVEEQAMRLLAIGQEVPGWKRVLSKPNRVWRDEGRILEVLRVLGFEEDQLRLRKTVSPAQAEKLLGKAAAAALEPYITKPEGSPVLAPATDEREALAPEL
jgi:hypothetical protein